MQTQKGWVERKELEEIEQTLQEGEIEQIVLD